MKFLIASDSHGALARIIEMMLTHPDIDNIIFLGDGDRDIDDIMAAYPEKTCHVVSGNCDHFSSRPDFDVFDICKVRILYTHGHRFQVKNGLASLKLGAKKLGAQFALYGHTHIPKTDESEGIIYFNPGSIRDGRYGILEISETRRVTTHYEL